METQAAPVHPAATRTELDEPSRSQHGPAPSKAAIAGHPIHPMLIPFPVALLSIVLVTDIVFAVTESTFWSSVSYYALWAGIVSAALAGVFGLIDFVGVPRARSVRAGWAHLLLNIAIVALATVNLILRGGDTIVHILPVGLTLSIVSTGLLLVSGWYGGELAYRHKIGVIGHDPTTRDAAR
ncbi:DUF2231 domain-containing protein [Enhygromyxa salina]|uniref:DUF2231 domain-containing protein n=1 Tax=Enhygromyxa salina TaxID=215803 RepID=A0A2S9XLF5_9BACT|nr:DUF2231 domain-containing protein [Enhygromyxa salina]PRP93685.1 hypothetical protein ENSA7_81130 [Enhygromyxa salina]